MIGEAGTKITGCRLKNASAQRVRAITDANLCALQRMIQYNAENGIRLFRISSDIVPFATHPAVCFDWRNEFAQTFLSIGGKIKEAGIRVSMHPGQYTVLNSPDERVYKNALLDLAYHTDFLEALGMPRACKIIVHAGGAYGDKKKAMDRFVLRGQALPKNIQSRIALENDDTVYTVEDVLTLSALTGFPAVFDTLHHAINPPKEALTVRTWMDRCALTWHAEDGRQKLHYSQPDGRRGAHSRTIDAAGFIEFLKETKGMDADVMLEVKDKNLSAVKCMKVIRGRVPAAELEQEWARYKYMVLSRSQKIYNEVRLFLKTKGLAEAARFYALIDAALAFEGTDGSRRNAAQHVWGYFKDRASLQEKKRFTALSGETEMDEPAVKRFLLRCAEKYDETYLKRSYYFYLD